MLLFLHFQDNVMFKFPYSKYLYYVSQCILIKKYYLFNKYYFRTVLAAKCSRSSEHYHLTSYLSFIKYHTGSPSKIPQIFCDLIMRDNIRIVQEHSAY